MVTMISYRGPSMSGGVSSSLGQAWSKHAVPGDMWCYIDANDLTVLDGSASKPRQLVKLYENLIGSHYRYCNEFLWPVMHDMEQYATFSAEDHRRYEIFNQVVARYVARETQPDQTGYFVHDYQLALLPSLLSEAQNKNSVVFWHIPWPKQVNNAMFVMHIMEITRSLLQASAIGFHTQEYADNFMKFVDKYLPDFHCDHETMTVTSGLVAVGAGSRSRPGARAAGRRTDRSTRLVVAPLGIDVDYWESLAASQKNSLWDPFLSKVQFILSVDRADYTKAVVNRMEAIDCFFQRFPQWRGNATFVQICTRSRVGLSAFDCYWNLCKRSAALLDGQCGSDDLRPLVWEEQSMTSAELALLYRRASVMLVNPIRDGLNLTAKEYVACQGSTPGVLALSPYAGVWHEFSDCSILVDPKRPEQMAEAIHTALSLSPSEKAVRMHALKDNLRQNSLDRWWQRFSELLEEATTERQPVTTPLPLDLIASRAG